MNRFEQRLQQRMTNPDFRAGYQEMEAELRLLRAIDEYRESLHISKDELARRMGRHRESISRTLTAQDANPTLDTITELLTALGVTAEITLRKAREGEAPIEVAIADASDQQTSSP